MKSFSSSVFHRMLVGTSKSGVKFGVTANRKWAISGDIQRHFMKNRASYFGCYAVDFHQFIALN